MVDPYRLNRLTGSGALNRDKVKLFMLGAVFVIILTGIVILAFFAVTAGFANPTPLASRFGEGVEAHANREPSLQLGQQVGGLADVEGARTDEQDVIGLDRSVARADGRALDQRQQVALHALP